MVELELLQRTERAVALLGERKPPLRPSVRSDQAIVGGDGLPEERERHADDHSDGDERSEDERRRHDEAGANASS
jgi:hypothetical protein